MEIRWFHWKSKMPDPARQSMWLPPVVATFARKWANAATTQTETSTHLPIPEGYQPIAGG